MYIYIYIYVYLYVYVTGRAHYFPDYIYILHPSLFCGICALCVSWFTYGHLYTHLYIYINIYNKYEIYLDI